MVLPKSADGLTDISLPLPGRQPARRERTRHGQRRVLHGQLANSTSANWQPLPGPVNQPIPGGRRDYPYAVYLPDGSLLVIGGGDESAGLYTETTALWRLGPGWIDVGADTPTRRAYHTTAVLLPDGRVMVGGGERVSPHTPIGPTGTSQGEHDYDIYLPH